MSEHQIKFYQTGTFTVGNRLLQPDQRSGQANIERYNSLNSGHRACQGCGEALGARYAVDAAMRATEGRLIAANATGCLEVFSTPYPETSWQLPWFHSLFGNTAAVGSGMAAVARVKAKKSGKPLVRVIAQGGDGGTTDIGFGCLSGMFERNDDVLYICYDNEGYMNTGVQRSSATPPAVRTATTQIVGKHPGNAFGQGKDVPLIAMAHGIPYVATATINLVVNGTTSFGPETWVSIGQVGNGSASNVNASLTTRDLNVSGWLYLGSRAVNYQYVPLTSRLVVSGTMNLYGSFFNTGHKTGSGLGTDVHTSGTGSFSIGTLNNN